MNMVDMASRPCTCMGACTNANVAMRGFIHDRTHVCSQSIAQESSIKECNNLGKQAPEESNN